MTHTILVVDDDPVQRRLAEAALTRAGYAVATAENGSQALELMAGEKGESVSAMLLDLMMPGIGGLEVLSKLREGSRQPPVIVQTAQGGIDTVISAMRAGAFDFVVKPASPDRLQAAFAAALKVDTVAGKTRRASRPSGGTVTFRDIVTRSPAMDRVLTLARKAAGSNIPIMIEGESGTGKELVARAIQGSGDRAAKPFVTVNCGALPENLVESILFGHEKGAFTGATEKHAGKFVEANGGTLFLDEIGDLPLDAQVKLLRAVQEGEVDAVGAAQSRKVDIRIISATHRDLMQAVRDTAFREDLYYRLNVFPIRVPPLRERKEDIPFLVDHFIARFAREQGSASVAGISPEALAILSAYDWPGNIRQLENAVFRAVVLCDGHELGPDEFPQIRAQVDGIDLSAFVAHEPSPVLAPEQPVVRPDIAASQTNPESHHRETLRVVDSRGQVRPLVDLEMELIRFAITHYDGQMSEVARRLGIGRSTLYRKLREYGLDESTDIRESIAS